MTPDPTPHSLIHGAAGFCTDHGQAPDERTETVARVLHDAHWRSTGSAMWEALTPTACRHCMTQAAAVVAALGKDGAGFWPALAGQNDRDAWAFMAERDAAHAALDRVRAEVEMVRGYAALDFATAAGVVVLLDKFAALDPEGPR